MRSRVKINIGKPFGPFDISGNRMEKSNQLENIGEELMSRIGALLPDDMHGVCDGDKRIPKFQKENGFVPPLIR